MFPMVTLASEIDNARALLDREVERVRRRNGPLPKRVLIGAMIETPAAAWNIAGLAGKVDFLSIGGNDLAQFYFAADRESERVQRRYDPMNPGFLNFLKHAVSNANAIGAPPSYCGEQAADLVTAAALVALGIREFSVPASAVGAFKRLIRSLDAAEASKWLTERFAAPVDSLRDEFAVYLRGKGVLTPSIEG